MTELTKASQLLYYLLKFKLGEGKFKGIPDCGPNMFQLEFRGGKPRVTHGSALPREANILYNFDADGEKELIRLSLAVASGKPPEMIIDDYRCLDSFLRHGVNDYFGETLILKESPLIPSNSDA